jgi:hypothetical protein
MPAAGWRRQGISRLDGGKDGMIGRARSKFQRCRDVFVLQIWIVFKYFRPRRAPANMSRTPFTRTRSPRMQGRPPHISGSTVMRFRRFDMSRSGSSRGCAQGDRADYCSVIRHCGDRRVTPSANPPYGSVQITTPYYSPSPPPRRHTPRSPCRGTSSPSPPSRPPPHRRSRQPPPAHSTSPRSPARPA